MPTKTSRRRAPKDEAAPTTEPEVLTAPDVAAEAPADTPPPKRGKAKSHEPSLDELERHLGQCSGLTPVREAILHLYGGEWTPDRELAVLRLIKADDRFVIVDRDRVNLVGLIASVAHTEHREALAAEAQPSGESIAPEPDTASGDGVSEPAEKTLGDHVAEAQASPKRIAWPHDVGSSVLLLTDGHPPKKAIIRNIADHGSFVLYDLATETGSTLDGVPANRIARDLDAEGEMAQMRMRMAALQRHIDHGAALAQKHVEMAATERRLAENLSEHRKAMAKLAEELAEHARSEPGQTDLRDVVGEGGPSRGEKMASEPTDAEDLLRREDAPAASAGSRKDAPAATATDAEHDQASGIQSLEQLGVTLDQVEAAAFNRATASTGKPQQVAPVAPRGASFARYLATDVANGIATLLPIVSAKEWASEWGDIIGKPRSLESDEPHPGLAAGGALCGIPVKVGRALAFIGPESAALLVRLPAKRLGDEPEPAASVGKDAAAGA